MGIFRFKQRVTCRPQVKPLLPAQVGSLFLLLIWLLALSQSLVRARVRPFPFHQQPSGPIWLEKPILEYFVFTPGLVERLPVESNLNVAQMAILEQAAQNEVKALSLLKQESLPIAADPQLTLEQKRQQIAAMDYNGRIKKILRASDQSLRSGLGVAAYQRLAGWIERQWIVEKELHGKAAAPSSLRTYRVFATRYDSNGAYRVALPDQCLKFANAGNSLCEGDGYVAGSGYTVFMSYEKSAAVIVGESGPWNIDDNYWALPGDPTPRRMFADLPLGMPEAQAAYFDGYNGGLDQFGRQVTAPFGIDLARQVSIDIGLQPGKNDWIDVSFMWTEGWDGAAPDKPGQTGAPQPPASTNYVIPVQMATPMTDGSITHVVQEGQSLWSIATAYQVSLEQILTLNGLVEGDVILPAQKLLIRPATTGIPNTPNHPPVRTLNPTEQPATEAASAAETERPPSAPDPVPSQSSDEEFNASSQRANRSSPAIDPIMAVILGFVLVGLSLIVLGTWLQKKP